MSNAIIPPKSEVIVKYNGDISAVGLEVSAVVEILGDNYAILTLPPENISLLNNFTEIEYVEEPKRLGIMATPSMQASCITLAQDAPYNLTGKGVIVATIDSGIDYAHLDFVYPDGTSRILFIWDQNIPGNPPEGFSIGTEFTNSEINAALNEADITRRMEMLPHEDTRGHGTAVAGVAVGNGRASEGAYIGAAPESSIIAVKLAQREGENFTRSTDLMRALKYIVGKAILANMPVVINISFGTNQGAHNDKTLFEQYVNVISDKWKTSIVVATGNEGSAGKHFYGKAANNTQIDAEFATGENLSSVLLVISKAFTDDFSYEIINSTGETTGIVRQNIIRQSFAIGSDTRVTFLMGQPTPYYGDHEIYIDISSVNGGLSLENWILRVRGVDVLDGNFDIWLPVTEVSGIDTRFLNPATEYSLTMPSTSAKVISAGGYNSENNSMAVFSGRGIQRDHLYEMPDVVAPAVNIISTAAGGGYDTFTGTSFAAPQVAGGAALLIEWGIVKENDLNLYGQRLKAYIRLGAVRNPDLSYPDPNWGFGRLCIKNSIDSLIEYKNAQSIRNAVFRETVPAESQQPQIEQQTLEAQKMIQTFVTDCISAAIDEEYYDVVLVYTELARKKISENPEIVVSGILFERYAIAHIPAHLYRNFKTLISLGISWNYPLLFGLMDRNALEHAGIVAVQNQPYLDLKGQGTLIGIIDTGIDFTMDSFIYEDGTSKIEFLWDQSLSCEGQAPFGYGREFSKEMITEALRSENPREIIPSVDEVGHGTFAASLAAGRDVGNNNIGAAPEADLMVVKLKKPKLQVLQNELVSPDVPSYQLNDIMAGIEYIRKKAIELQRPVAFYFGLGSNSGAHDGLGLLATFITEMSSSPGFATVIANGNESNKSHHASGKIPDDGTPYYLEIKSGEAESGFILNLWVYVPDRISISLRSPTGDTFQRIPYGIDEIQEIEFVLEQTNIRVLYLYPSEKNGGQSVIVRFEKPTPGIWTISIYGDLILNGTFHAWLPISQFVEPDTVFLSPDPYYTYTIPSGSFRTTSVGAYNTADGSLYAASGRGPAIMYKTLPTLCAPGVEVGGLYPGSQPGTMTGTSVAAAITTGAAALLLQWGIVNGYDPQINSLKVQTYLIQGCRQDEGLIYPNPMWGHGKLDLYRTTELIQI